MDTNDSLLQTAAAPKEAHRPGWGWKRAFRVLALLVPTVLLGAVVYSRTLAPVPVAAHQVGVGVVEAEVFGRGTIESEREAQLGFDLVGRLSEVLVEEGARVTLGQTLARLYPEQVSADFRAAKSGVLAARSSLTRLAAEERRARAAAEAAEREQRRVAELSLKGAVAAHDLDLAEDAMRVTRAELDRVLAQRMEATRTIDVAEGGAAQRGATMLRATLLSPFDGLISRRLREPGDTVTVGTTVLRLVDTDNVYVSAWIDETMLHNVREGQTARIALPGQERSFSGIVKRVGFEADRQTHELLVDVAPLQPIGRVAIGQRADVWLLTHKKDAALNIPLAYLQREATQTFCYVDRGGRVAKVPIETGLVGRDRVEITRGLKSGDVVLTSLVPAGQLAHGRRWRRP